MTTMAALITATETRGWRFTPPSPQAVSVPDPAAGADWSWVAPTGKLLVVGAVFAAFDSSATVANRTPHLQVTAPGVGLVVDVPILGPVAASSSVRCQAMAVAPNWNNADGRFQWALGQGTFPPGCTVGVVTTNLSAGDQWSDIALVVELV